MDSSQIQFIIPLYVQFIAKPTVQRKPKLVLLVGYVVNSLFREAQTHSTARMLGKPTQTILIMLRETQCLTVAPLLAQRENTSYSVQILLCQHASLSMCTYVYVCAHVCVKARESTIVAVFCVRHALRWLSMFAWIARCILCEVYAEAIEHACSCYQVCSV
jgi:hypothetical protein